MIPASLAALTASFVASAAGGLRAGVIPLVWKSLASWKIACQLTSPGLILLIAELARS